VACTGESDNIVSELFNPSPDDSEERFEDFEGFNHPQVEDGHSAAASPLLSASPQNAPGQQHVSNRVAQDPSSPHIAVEVFK
jgi:hypothetical protein